MFIITAKCSKRRVVKILLIFALLLSLFLALRACRHSSPPPVIAAGTNEERIAYLASLGWEVNDQPIETLSVTLGETLEEPYLSYNDLQRSQGFDLTRYCGQTLSRYTYVVTNYPDASLPCQADLYVCDGTPEEPALLTVAMDTNAETDMLCAMLRSYDIPVLRKYEGEGSFGKIVLGMPGSGTWLYVPSSMLEDAKNLIRPIDEIPEQEDMQ